MMQMSDQVCSRSANWKDRDGTFGDKTSCVAVWQKLELAGNLMTFDPSAKVAGCNCHLWDVTGQKQHRREAERNKTAAT